MAGGEKDGVEREGGDGGGALRNGEGICLIVVGARWTNESRAFTTPFSWCYLQQMHPQPRYWVGVQRTQTLRN